MATLRNSPSGLWQRVRGWFGQKDRPEEETPPEDSENDEENDDRGRPKKSWLYLNVEHWLVKLCASKTSDPGPLAWLLLAAYAYINEILQPVTNDHEQSFQLSVWAALADGELSWRD